MTQTPSETAVPEPGCPTDLPGADAEGWLEYPLADFPELADVGGQVTLSDPDNLLQAVVAQIDDDCFIAAWRICPHGACDVEWRPEEADLWCPCHGSRFDAQGTLLQGPAQRDLRTFPAEVRGDRLRIYRPL